VSGEFILRIQILIPFDSFLSGSSAQLSPSYCCLFTVALYKMPSSSLFLRSSATLVSVLSVLSSLARGASSAYVLDTEFSGTTFFEGFNFFDVWSTCTS
jgi:hypothetical protein